MINQTNTVIEKFDRQIIDSFNDFCDDFSHLPFSALVFSFCKSREVEKGHLLNILNECEYEN
jgi:hypothetical protein